MMEPIVVRVFGTPIACSKGVIDAWRNVSRQAAGQLAARFGESVTLEYYDLFSADMDRFPEVLAKVQEGAAIPLVFIGQDLISAGGKISVPAIARQIEKTRSVPPA